MWNPFKFKPKPHPLLEKITEAVSQLHAFYYAVQDIAFALIEIQELLDDLRLLVGQLNKSDTHNPSLSSTTGGPELPVFDEWALLQSVVRTRFDKDPHRKKMGSVETAVDYIWEGLPPKYRTHLGNREQSVRDTIRGLYLAIASVRQELDDEPSKETDA
jgi:hypothetical protein